MNEKLQISSGMKKNSTKEYGFNWIYFKRFWTIQRAWIERWFFFTLFAFKWCYFRSFFHVLCQIQLHFFLSWSLYQASNNIWLIKLAWFQVTFQSISKFIISEIFMISRYILWGSGWKGQWKIQNPFDQQLHSHCINDLHIDN